MKTKILMLLCLCFMLQATTCDEGEADGTITVKNTDDEPFSCSYAFDEEMPGNYIPIESWYMFEPGDQFELPFSDYDFSGSKKFIIYFYKQSTLDNHTREEAEQQGLYDARYEFTRDQLITQDYIVEYDGN